MADLSPAAKAVLDAYLKAPCDYRLSVTAALFAAADQVAPLDGRLGKGYRQHRSANAERLAIRRELLAIAAELKGPMTDTPNRPPLNGRGLATCCRRGSSPSRSGTSTLRDAALLALTTLEGWSNYDQWVWPISAMEQAKRGTTEALAALRMALSRFAPPAAGEVAELVEWQPIKTAPKDGSIILLYRPNCCYPWAQVDVGKWDDDRYATKKPRPFWRSMFARIGTTEMRNWPPTHWQPRPPVPLPAGEVE